MTSTPSPAFKNWPEEIASVYGKLPVPSLYEFVLANEKFAAEMRRHGKDLHKMANAIFQLKELLQGLEQQLQMGFVEVSEANMDDTQDDPELPLSPATPSDPEEEDADNPVTRAYYPAWEVDMMRQASKFEQRQWEETYVTMLEIILQTMQEQKILKEQTLSLLSPIKTAKTAAVASTHLFSLHEEKVTSIKDQMLAHLKDIDIETIIPEIGDLYDEDFHRVIESVSGLKGAKHKKNTVARVVRIGYKRHGELVRQADVCVYE